MKHIWVIIDSEGHIKYYLDYYNTNVFGETSELDLLDSFKKDHKDSNGYYHCPVCFKELKAVSKYTLWRHMSRDHGWRIARLKVVKQWKK